MSSSRKPNVLIRIWLGFWRGLTALRMAVFNIVFLLILGLLIRVFFFADDGLRIEPDTTLVIAPVGLIVEEYTGTPGERAINEALGQEMPETRLRDILAALEAAAEDERIVQVLIDTDQLWGLAPGMMMELSAAFQRLRASGKPVIAYGGSMNQGQYMLASLADELWLHPDGLVILEGYGRFRQYYREGLEKLAVDVNLFRVGEYKSAMEPFIRNDMSDEARQSAEYWLNGLWSEYLRQVASHRGMPADVLVDLIENVVGHLSDSGGDAAAMALESGLVDRLMAGPEVRAELASRGAPDDNGGFRKVGFMDYINAESLLPVSGKQVGIIVAQGAITEGNQPPGTIGSASTARRIRQAARNDDIKAVVLRIDSGGGSAFASEVIRRELVALRDSGKPLVVSMGNVAASGGYWIAMGADEVWAYPTTITGSIGIFGFFPTFQDTLGKIGVHTDGVGTTWLSGGLRADRALSDGVSNLLQTIIEHGYREFIDLVAAHRPLNPEQVDAVARGRVWTGEQARQRGLVDRLGTLDEAVSSAAAMAGLGEDYRIRYVEPELAPWQAFLMNMGARAVAAAGVDAIPRASFWLPRQLLARLQSDLGLIVSQADSGRPGIMAHCLCEAPL